jgi:hypothetical protein
MDSINPMSEAYPQKFVENLSRLKEGYRIKTGELLTWPWESINRYRDRITREFSEFLDYPFDEVVELRKKISRRVALLGIYNFAVFGAAGYGIYKGVEAIASNF